MILFMFRSPARPVPDGRWLVRPAVNRARYSQPTALGECERGEQQHTEEQHEGWAGGRRTDSHRLVMRR